MNQLMKEIFLSVMFESLQYLNDNSSDNSSDSDDDPHKPLSFNCYLLTFEGVYSTLLFIVAIASNIAIVWVLVKNIKGSAE
jgi:hypothetical protein